MNVIFFSVVSTYNGILFTHVSTGMNFENIIPTDIS